MCVCVLYLTYVGAIREYDYASSYVGTHGLAHEPKINPDKVFL